MKPGLVVQSHRRPLPHPWLQQCLDSVAAWADRQGFDYRFLDDDLFALLEPELLARTRARPVVAADLARLRQLRAALIQGYETVLWCDADFLIYRPEALVLPETAYGVGREVWVQAASGGRGLRAYVKVHNAFMFFRHGNPFLDFYLDAAERMVLAHRGPMVPQLVGPKLLTALHNLVALPVVEAAGVLSPLVVRSLLGGSGAALRLQRRRSRCLPAGVNLCASSVARGDLDDADMAAVCQRLLADPDCLVGPTTA
jgi:alkanesulfonate monooxygenase SsuD/methylene tetrahydromethanopterin reductase-like flavin-dependent oxidoreductase (luciferase family)